MTLAAVLTLVVSQRTFSEPKLLCRLNLVSIDESSGVAASTKSNGVYYTHNDSGDSARFFRFDRRGEVDATFSLAGCGATDWEDMASAVVGAKSYLYFGDIGDNARKRKSIQVYRVLEPAANAVDYELRGAEKYSLEYPDKPRDCEALAVHPATGDLWLISKATDGETVVYKVPAPKKPGSFTMIKVATLTLDTGGLGGKLVTGADISPDGKFVVLRTYSGAAEYSAGRSFADWVKATPTMVKTAGEKQGEAICYGSSGKELLTTSEGSPCPISFSTVTNR